MHLPPWAGWLRALRRVRVDRQVPVGALGRGVALRGALWLGDDPVVAAYPDAVVIVGPDGRIAALGPTSDLRVPEGVRVLGGPGCWVGPGVVDAHVHLAFGSPEESLAAGVVGLRDLGAPPASARMWRSAARPCCAVAGPVVTAPGGYPSTSWGAGGFAAFAADPNASRRLVRELAREGVDLIKVAVEPGDGLPVPDPATLRGLVEAAHDSGLPVTAHALTVEAVGRVLDAGVDELAHTPVEPLGERLVERVAASGVSVVSTLQTFCAGGDGRVVQANASALHAAGVRIIYGTDLGNSGTRPGVDPRELDRLADVGLGRDGALLAATTAGRYAVGLAGVVPDGRVVPGRDAALVVLAGDPLDEPNLWRVPVAVVAAGTVVSRPAG